MDTAPARRRSRATRPSSSGAPGQGSAAPTWTSPSRRPRPSTASARRPLVSWPRRAAAAMVGAAALLGLAGPAGAHPSLVQASPEAGAVAPAAPHEVALSFSEPVVRAGSSVTLLQPDGGPVRLGPLVRRGDSELAASVEGTLAPAVYAVRWSALGDDGHTVTGTFRFGVPRPGGGAPPGAEVLGTTAPGGRQSGGGDSAFGVAARWLGLVAAGVLLAGALLRDVVREARRRRLAAVGLLAVTLA